MGISPPWKAREMLMAKAKALRHGKRKDKNQFKISLNDFIMRG
jgi:hypothetical protein